MPVYTYRCENCGNQFEQYQKFTEQPLTRCPSCEKKTLRKVYSPVGIVFKGSGFYSTDNRSPSGQARGSKTGDHGDHEKSGDGASAEKSGGDSKEESKSSLKEASRSESKDSRSDSKKEEKASSTSSTASTSSSGSTKE